MVDRQLSAEDHAQQLQQVRRMWQLAAVLEFLHVFSMHLQLRDSFTPEELEVAIVAETGQTGMLAALHQVHPYCSTLAVLWRFGPENRNQPS